MLGTQYLVDVKFQVTNTGSTPATSVTATCTPPTTGLFGVTDVDLVNDPNNNPSNIAPGSSVTYVWRYRVDFWILSIIDPHGTFTFSATGTNTNTASSSVTLNYGE